MWPVCDPGGMECVDCLGLDSVAYAALSGCSELEWRCTQCKKGAPKSPSLDALIADRLGEVLVAIGGVLERLAGFEDRLWDKTDVGRTITLERSERFGEDVGG